MTNAEAVSSTENSVDLKGKTLLLISSPNPTKRFIFQRLKALGARLVLLSAENTWAARYADAQITADTLDRRDCLEKVEAFLKENQVDGALTFWENAVPLCAALCERFGWPGHTLIA